MATTTVTLTGTGVPHPSPGRAGPGVLIRHGAVALQFDAGRGTVLRLSEAGVACHDLDALFVTHVHSDHVVDLADVVMTRWIQGTLHPAGPLPVLDKLTPSEIKFIIDLTGLQVGTHQVTPRSEILITDIQVQSLIPATIEVTIKLNGSTPTLIP